MSSHSWNTANKVFDSFIHMHKWEYANTTVKTDKNDQNLVYIAVWAGTGDKSVMIKAITSQTNL